MNEQWSIGVILTLSIFVITHIITTVWWASKVNTLLEVVRIELSNVGAELKAARQLYSTKEEVSIALALSEKEQAAIWRNIDELKRDFKDCRNDNVKHKE